MSDQAVAATPNMTAATQNAAIISDARAAAKAAIMADDSISMDGGDAPAQETSTEAAPAVETKTTEAPADQEKPALPSLSELEQLAAQKRRERMEREANDEAGRRLRDFDREREEFERRRRDFEAHERELLADPFEYAEKRKGWDRSQAAEKLVAKQLRPTEELLKEQIEALKAELSTFRNETKAEREQRERAEQEASERARYESTYASWDTLSANTERFPHMAKLPSAIRRMYGDHVANLLTEAGVPWTQEEIANRVEHDLASKYGIQAEANGSKAGELKRDGSPQGGAKPPPSTLTNDLAGQSAGSQRSLLDPEVRRANALREAERLGLK
jgi:hypothetical protein